MNKQLVILIFVILGISTLNAQPKYLNPEVDLESRVDDLISRLTLEEKVDQMLMNTSGIPRLDIPPYDYWNEALHGVGRSGKATIFPQAIGLAASFDNDLIYRVSSAISDEARAMYNIMLPKLLEIIKDMRDLPSGLLMLTYLEIHVGDVDRKPTKKTHI